MLYFKCFYVEIKCIFMYHLIMNNHTPTTSKTTYSLSSSLSSTFTTSWSSGTALGHVVTLLCQQYLEFFWIDSCPLLWFLLFLNCSWLSWADSFIFIIFLALLDVNFLCKFAFAFLMILAYHHHPSHHPFHCLFHHHLCCPLCCPCFHCHALFLFLYCHLCLFHFHGFAFLF